MGKASRWFRGLFGLNNNKKQQQQQQQTKKQQNKAPNNNKAAAKMMTCTGSTGRCYGARVSEERAAVVIQSHFRSYLARRALRALKSLVKLQALVRGHNIRKQTSDVLRRMQAVVRAQARARTSRLQISESPSSSAKSSSQFCNHGPATPEKFEQSIRSKSTRRDMSPILKRNCSNSTAQVIYDQEKALSGRNWLNYKTMEGSFNQIPLSTKFSYIDIENSVKVLEVDTTKSHLTPKRKKLLHSDQYSQSFSTSKDSTAHQTLPSPSSYEVRSFSPLKASHETDESTFCTAHNSPQFLSAHSRNGSYRKSPFTPTKSDGSKSYLSMYGDYPNYMACTESSKAKVRSVSAPKQRPNIERSSSTKRYLVYNNYGEIKMGAQNQRGSSIHASFVNKAYPGSGRLDRLGFPGTMVAN